MVEEEKTIIRNRTKGKNVGIHKEHFEGLVGKIEI